MKTTIPSVETVNCHLKRTPLNQTHFLSYDNGNDTNKDDHAVHEPQK